MRANLSVLGVDRDVSYSYLLDWTHKCFTEMASTRVGLRVTGLDEEVSWSYLLD